MKKILSKKMWVAITLLLVLVITFSIFMYFHGRTNSQAIRDIQTGADSEQVTSLIGSPKQKTIDYDEIINWAPESLKKNMDEYPQLEMYTYKIENGEEARLFFSQDQLIYKHPLKLNMSTSDYLDMYLK
ncbi:hypothetical protein EL472_11740 [Enterococcus faecalis]|uniref:hypothetical protein n=1 Tax=Enterococcus faecalis TaxID=1351 RepID=UPI00046C797D|nr:hypothetical protein [Enterococcus faecalis]EGO8499868.1 hypothetical protein [Enterococcus faecalis]EGO9464967.1 hypothetical protein [Enterococcus faecalis]NSP13585.1 hypothetical protein [Enterococcus faecalis]